MSKYEPELRRRLARGEPIETVVRWYLACAAADKQSDWKDLSVFEVRFMKQIESAFRKWQRTRKN
jgi:hypothetical protein